MDDGTPRLSQADAVARIGQELQAVGADIRKLEERVAPALAQTEPCADARQGRLEFQDLDRILQHVEGLAAVLRDISKAMEDGHSDMAPAVERLRLAALRGSILPNCAPEVEALEIELF